MSWGASRGAGGLALLPGEARGAGRDTGGVPGAPLEPAAALQEGKLLDRVYNTYLLMHTHQTVDFVQKKVRDPHGVHLQPHPSLPGGAPLPPGRVPRGLGSPPSAPPCPQSAQYGSCSLRKMSAMEALELLDQLVDESDPDVDFPNSYHAYQTAEGIRRAHPDKGRAGDTPPR